MIQYASFFWGHIALERSAEENDMTKSIHKGKRKVAETVARKARAGRFASVMKPEYLALIANFRLMDDTFMSKCLERAPECIELMLRIILGKKNLTVVKLQTEICKLVQDLRCRDAAKMYFDVLRKQVSQFKDSEEGRHAMCKAMEELGARREARGEARGKAEGKRETMIATAKRMLKSGMLALKDVAKFSGLTLAQVKKLQASMA